MAHRVTGEIFDDEQMKKLLDGMAEVSLPSDIFAMFQNQPTKDQMDREPPRVKFDEPCPCDSGYKFGACCHIKKVEGT